MILRSNYSIDNQPFPKMMLVSNYCLDICVLTELFARLIGHIILHKTTVIDYLVKIHTIIGLCYMRTEYTSWINSLRPRDPYFPYDIFKCLSCMQMHELRLKFHWNLFLGIQLIIFKHWFRWWLDADQATSHYLKQCWYGLLKHVCVTRLQWVICLLWV